MRRIYLIGFMGAGKTTVGRALAALLHWEFVDLDAEIEREQGITIREIFEKLGEPRFRQIERETLKTVSKRTDAVIAVGGGAYIDPENRAIADSAGLTVWLKVSFANAVSRVTIGGARPLFQDREKAERLYHDRLPFYRRARLHVSADGESPEAIAREIDALIAPYRS
ncbi:MAG TPA: shikimate kinase [Terriglobia bacterium]|nr:shikimate kinase [Terriglobia bacterium]